MWRPTKGRPSRWRAKELLRRPLCPTPRFLDENRAALVHTRDWNKMSCIKFVYTWTCVCVLFWAGRETQIHGVTGIIAQLSCHGKNSFHCVLGAHLLLFVFPFCQRSLFFLFVSVASHKDNLTELCIMIATRLKTQWLKWTLFYHDNPISKFSAQGLGTDIISRSPHDRQKLRNKESTHKGANQCLKDVTQTQQRSESHTVCCLGDKAHTGNVSGQSTPWS